MRIEVVAAQQVGARGAAMVAAGLRDAVAARGHATVAFSGGSAARDLLEALAHEDVAWQHVHVLQVDERVAPEGHQDRNLEAIRSVLLDHVDIPPEHIHPMAVCAVDLEQAAAAYAQVLSNVAGEPPTLDVVHLGLGSDGHTASLLPGSAVTLSDAASVMVTGAYQGRRRMTLTAPTLSRARNILWLVAGAAKADVVRRFVDADPALPATHIDRSRSVVLLDPAAAARLT